MDMPVVVEVVDDKVRQEDIEKIFEYFKYIDDKFSTFKEDSEITRINRGEIKRESSSNDMQEVLRLCDETEAETDGYFTMHRGEKLDPLGLVKGWAIWKAAGQLKDMGYKKYYVDAGGDIQTAGRKWRVGIRNPFNRNENVRIVEVDGQGVATSGTYIRGQHVVNPKKLDEPITEIVSLSVIGPNIYEADRMATAAFAMGKLGIGFISKLKGFEGYMISKDGVATFTPGWEKYAIH